MGAFDIEYHGVSARLQDAVRKLLGAYTEVLAASVLSEQEAEAVHFHIDEIHDMVGLFAADRFEEEALCVHFERELAAVCGGSRRAVGAVTTAAM